MIQLSLGLLAFTVPHLWKRLSPVTRARFGEPGKGMVAVLLIGGIWLMARGYRAWVESPQVWFPAIWLRDVNNLMVLVAFYLFVSSGMKTWGARVTRHPQLWAIVLWATAHLLVNGDLASILLFGGLLAWAVVAMILISRQEPRWVPPPHQPIGKEITAVVVALAVYGVVGYVHGRIGPWPFGT